MIQRDILQKLQQWKENKDRKPLILRGARQVGKTTVIQEFSKQYDIFLPLNLEKEADRQLFEEFDDVDKLIRAIFFFKKVEFRETSTLLFIDEIQHSKKAVAILRYFYEQASHIHVVVAGSLLETVMDVRKISFPVGRVQYMAMRPCSFLEFLDGIGEQFDAELVKNRQVLSVVHNRVIEHFNNYVLVGGMPAAVNQYSINRDILSVKDIYESLLTAYQDDVEKYTSNDATMRVIRSILNVGWYSAGECITFEKFGGTAFSSRDMSLAFQTIQKAMLLELVYPTAEAQLPLLQNFRKKPKLVWLDTGLVNYFSGIQKDVFSVKDIMDIWRGRIAEHIVAQELLTLDNSVLNKRIYWRRDKEGSEAEVDFVYKYSSMAIPIEVKSGHNSKLKSLHLFMEKSPHNYAVRVWSQPFSIDEATTLNGKKFYLINLPFYYVGVLDKILDQYIKMIF
ncbi:MAG: AAA family ATPase [Bacteroidales bacterium]|jgi:predicted AAA+ superfamily ATPase|nr:AAA family ATPase [Bacteroidales bacterium]